MIPQSSQPKNNQSATNPARTWDQSQIMTGDALHNGTFKICNEIFNQRSLLESRSDLLEIARSLYREGQAFVLNYYHMGFSGEAMANNMVNLPKWSKALHRDLDREGDAETLGRRIAAEWQANLHRRGRQAKPEPKSLSPESTPIFTFFLVPDFELLITRTARDDLQLLKKYYTASDPHRAILIDDESHLLNSGDAPRVRELILRLAGAGSNVSEIIKHFKGAPPLVPGHVECEVKDGKKYLRSQVENYRLPYGSLEVSREFLEIQQKRIEHGEISGLTVTIKGRVDPKFLNWACGSNRAEAGFLPDIELLYSFPLPSGANFIFALKSARSYSQRQPQDESNWTASDRYIAKLLGDFFADASQRKSWKLFSAIKASDFSSELQDAANDPCSIENMEEYLSFCRQWHQSIYKTLATQDGGARATYSRVPWLSPEYEDRAFFERVLRERLVKVPDEQQFFAPDYLRLSAEEIEAFMHALAGKLYDICKSERDRVLRESRDGTLEQRAADGYRGPPEGFPLPLDYMIMDMIVDERRYQEYRRESAERKGIPPDKVRVPLQLGRSFWHPEWFLDADGLAKDLAANPPQRSIEVLIYDPLASQPIVPFPSRNINKLASYIDLTNIERLIDAASNLSIESDAQPGHGPRALHVLSFHAAEKELIRTARLRHAALDEAEHVRALRMEELVNKFKAMNLARDEYRKRIASARSELDRTVESVESEAIESRKALLLFYEANWPGGFRRFCLRLHSITDQCASTYIYSIGAAGSPIFNPAHRGFKRTHSESLCGRNMYAGGEAVIGTHFEAFSSLESWAQFDRTFRLSPIVLVLRLLKATDGSGHYEPLPVSLDYAVPNLRKHLEPIGIRCNQVVLEDGVTPRMRMRGLTYDFAHG